MAELQRTLSYKVLLLITINSIMGSGMFFLPAIGASVAGPASIISWVLLAIISIYAAACFGELVSMHPKSGGVYEFSKQAFGEFPGFMMGWVAWLVGNLTTAMLVVGAVTYLLPQTGPMTTGFKIGASIAWVLILNYLTYRGVKTSAVMLVSFAVATIGLIAFLMTVGIVDLPGLATGTLATNLDPGNLIPFFPEGAFAFSIIPILIGVFLISEAFFGIESICFLGGETREPEKNLPRALVTATIIIATLTIIYVAVSLMMVPWQTFAGLETLSGEAAAIFGQSVTAPYAYLAWTLLGDTGMRIVTLWTYIVIIGSAAGFIVTTPRLILAVAKDELFPKQFAELHHKHATPHKAIWFQALITSIFIIVAFLMGDRGYQTLLGLLVPIVLLMMAAVVIIVPVLRRKSPDYPRAYNVWFPRAGPWLLALIYAGLFVTWFLRDAHEAIRITQLAVSFVVVGVPVYYVLRYVATRGEAKEKIEGVKHD